MSRPAVLFDFGGTLDADGLHWAARFYAAYRTAGGSTEFAAFETLFKVSDRALERLPQIRTLGFQAMIETQARLVCDLLPDGSTVDPGRLAARFHADAVATVQRNRPLLERLGQIYHLGVVSNFTGNLERCLAELELSSSFAVVADSAVVGVAKPDRRIFAETLARLGTPAAQAWMVGDNFEMDIRPAAALGMRTCWVAPAERRVPAGLAPSGRVAHLLELEDLLQSDPCTV
jgi:putative hydrolase of the HAD superfamily